MSFVCAQSRIVEQTAADCDTKAIFPGLATIWEKLALSPIRGINNPRLFGPSIFTLALRAVSISACFKSLSIPNELF